MRGAYGIFYETVNADIIQNNSQPFRYTFTFQTPVQPGRSAAGPAGHPAVGEHAEPRCSSASRTLFYPDPALRTPYVQHFNLNVQRRGGQGPGVQVGYVGKVGRKLLMGLALNPGPLRARHHADRANLDQRRPMQRFGVLDNDLLAGQLQLQRDADGGQQAVQRRLFAQGRLHVFPLHRHGLGHFAGRGSAEYLRPEDADGPLRLPRQAHRILLLDLGPARA